MPDSSVLPQLVFAGGSEVAWISLIPSTADGVLFRAEDFSMPVILIGPLLFLVFGQSPELAKPGLPLRSICWLGSILSRLIGASLFLVSSDRSFIVSGDFFIEEFLMG